MRQWLAVIVVLVLTRSALCGDIHGTVTSWPTAGNAPSARHGLVWLTSGPDSVPPSTRPVMGQFKGRFAPDFLAIVAGQTVEMPNRDEVAHNVYSNSPSKKFNLGFYAKGDHQIVTFDVPGLVEVRCSIHQAMRATIFVVPNSHFAIIKEDGSFELKNIPKGSYTLKFWAEGMSSESHDVTVGTGDRVEVTLNGMPSRAAESVKIGAN